MADTRRQLQHDSGVHLDDILFALFKRKSTVLFCALLGIIAAAGLYSLWPAIYESRAKLLVRYVLERSGVDPVEAERAVTASSNEGDRVIGAEVEILTSWDLAVQVADAIGPSRLGASSKEAAAMSILSGLISTVLGGAPLVADCQHAQAVRTLGRPASPGGQDGSPLASAS